MKRIYKYPIRINLTETTKIQVPKGSIVRKVANQKNQLFVWIEVNSDETENEDLFFATFHTVDYLPANPMRYLDTVFFHSNSYVVHVYQLNQL